MNVEVKLSYLYGWFRCDGRVRGAVTSIQFRGLSVVHACDCVYMTDGGTASSWQHCDRHR